MPGRAHFRRRRGWSDYTRARQVAGSRQCQQQTANVARTQRWKASKRAPCLRPADTTCTHTSPSPNHPLNEPMRTGRAGQRGVRVRGRGAEARVVSRRLAQPSFAQHDY